MVDVKKAAELLIAARNDNRKIEALPSEAEPKTLKDAYAIQDEILRTGGYKLAGWKVALTNDEAMERADAAEPAAGPLFARHVSATPQTIEGGSESVAGFECEFAFRLGKDIPAEGAPYTGQVVAAGVDSLHPAIEVVGIRIANRPSLGVNGLVADFSGNFSFVYGPAVPGWQKVDLAKCAVRHLVDGEEVAASTGANVLDNPLNALAWLANHLARRGHELKAGQWVTTGAATGPIPAPVGSTVTADFEGLGKVEVRFKN
jgi:2-oxo-3-hexenedioate decarboxylase